MDKPNLLKFALDCEFYGAEGITVHPRPDERHIRYDDIPVLNKEIETELNIEGYPSERFIDMVLENKPKQVTLVPDPPEALTSTEGWDTINQQKFLVPIIDKFQKSGIRVSLFLNPVEDLVRAAADTGADRIEFYTGTYAHEYIEDRETAIVPYKKAAAIANEVQLGLNAGHDLNLSNLRYFYQHVDGLLEVSIGHGLICDAINSGLKRTIHSYLGLLQP